MSPYRGHFGHTRIPLLVTFFGTAISSAAFLFMAVALYVFGQLSPAMESSTIFNLEQLFIRPIEILFQGSFFTFTIGFLPMIFGGMTILTSNTM